MIVKTNRGNVDDAVVKGFGNEWSKFTQAHVSKRELQSLFKQYFDVFPWAELSSAAAGADIGCGSGRWAQFVAPRVKVLHCVDASTAALQVAKANLAEHPNCEFWNTDIEHLPFSDNTLDFAYSLGVLHHVPDTLKALKHCVAKLKPGAPFLLYVYYALDNKPPWYRAIWRASDFVRRLISTLPFRMRSIIAEVIAMFVYWPLARIARVLDRIGANVDSFPLSCYRDRSFYVLRTDALDRFGTALEHRFTKRDIELMMRDAGLHRIRFSSTVPYWCAVGIKQ
jgi:SAM-dependent methyltransferase